MNLLLTIKYVGLRFRRFQRLNYIYNQTVQKDLYMLQTYKEKYNLSCEEGRTLLIYTSRLV